MCGIVGAIFMNGVTNENLIPLHASLNSMARRGPDSSGWQLFEASKSSGWSASNHEDQAVCFKYAQQCRPAIMIGHRRLSIIDLSNAGHQPMSCLDGKIWITYNGEVYNYIELRGELEQLGEVFNTNSDTEVVLRSYKVWGNDCFSRFNGMWGMAIVDLNKKKLLLSRDRFGIKPLYYCKTEKSTFFGSTIQSVLLASNMKRESRRDIVRDFLLYGLQPSGVDTFFHGVFQVENGCLIEIDINQQEYIKYSKQTWWNLCSDSIADSEAVGLWQDTFEDAVRIRMRSDVPIGTCLSGGIDSSAIVAFMNKLNPRQDIHTFTACYTDRKWDERRYVELMLRKIQANPVWIYPEKASLTEDLNWLHSIQEQPIPTISIYNQFCVMRAAKESGVTVLLDGQGADELFLGYDSCQTLHMLSLLRQGKLRELVRKFTGLSVNRSSMSSLDTLKMMVYFGLPIVRKSINYLKMHSVLKSELLRSPGKGSFSVAVDNRSDLQISRKNWVDRHPLPSLLHYEDRNSMAFSIETRLPFLDYRMVNLAFSISSSMLEKNGWPKYICRKGIESFVPDEIVWRKDKMGFPGPTSQFIKRNRDLFLDLFRTGNRSSPVVNGEKVCALLASGKPPEWLWRILSLEVWLRVMNVEA